MLEICSYPKFEFHIYLVKKLHYLICFGFYEKYLDEDHSKGMFADVNYRQVSLGLRKKDYSLTFEKEKYVNDNYNNFLNFDSYFNGDISTHNDVLKQINLS